MTEEGTYFDDESTSEEVTVFQPIVALARLDQLAAKIDAGDIGRAGQWRGADTVVVSEPAPHDPGAFYPPDLEVVTEHVAEVSWIFCELRDAFDTFLDWSNKEWFFETIATALNEAIEEIDPADTNALHDVLSAGVKTGYDILKELEAERS